MKTMSELLFLDIETRSRIDLPVRGVYNYAQCPSTELLCMSYAFDDSRVWDYTGGTFPVAINEHILAGRPVVAHGASFERLLWQYVIANDFDTRAIPMRQWLCSMYKARCNNLPASLDGLSRALDLDVKKNTLRGYQLIRALCVPGNDGKFYWNDSMFEEMVAYCNDDVGSMREAWYKMREPSAQEWEDYYVNEEINDRGIHVDVGLCQAATSYANQETDELVARIKVASQGEVEKARGEKLKAWIVDRITDDQVKILTKKKSGQDKISLDKYTRARLLDTELAPDVREVLECSDLAQKSSVSKFKTMAAMADDDDHRVRGALVANGASASGRYSSRGCQVHNMTRKSVEDPGVAREYLLSKRIPQDEESVMTFLSKMLRPAITPHDDDQSFLVSDWSAIEGRVAPWLSDCPAGEAKLDLFRRGVDTYIATASSIYGIPEDEIGEESTKRQAGKVAELALGFGGGVNAYQSMARNYGLKVTDDEADVIKTRWRRANPWAPKLWKACEHAAIQAVLNPGMPFKAGRVVYVAVRDILVGGVTLFCSLPCDRVLTYPDARVTREEGPYGSQSVLSAMRAAWKPKVGEKEWPRVGLWGGHLVENNTQGVAASLLREKLRDCMSEDLPVVLHVHDEIVVETEPDYIDQDKLTLLRIMLRTPSWAEGLPLLADVKTMRRYGK
jgi:DNA polymerase